MSMKKYQLHNTVYNLMTIIQSLRLKIKVDIKIYTILKRSFDLFDVFCASMRFELFYAFIRYIIKSNRYFGTKNRPYVKKKDSTAAGSI